MSTKPFPYQKETVAQIQKFGGRALLALEQGLGKSACSLWWMRRHMKGGATVVVCPAYLKTNWQREVVKHLGRNAHVFGTTKPPKRLPRMVDRNAIYILNYDVLHAWVDYLDALKVKLYVFDEGHYLGNPSSRRTRYARALSKRAKYVHVLTGTPIPSKVRQLWPILDIVIPAKRPGQRKFYRRYCGPKLTSFGWTFDGATRLKELHKRLVQTCMIRRRKDEVMKDLPPITHTVIPLPIVRPREYAEAERDLVRWLMKTRPNRANRARKDERRLRFNYLRQLTAELKMPNVRKWVEDFTAESGEKLVAFGVHREKVMDVLHSWFPKTSVLVTGKTAAAKRMELFDQFNSDRKTRVLFGNVQAAGTGWNCTATSDVAIVEPPWTPGELEQAAARAHGQFRGKRGRPCTVYFLVGVGTVDEELLKILQAKAKVVDEAIDGGKTVNKLEVMDKLEEVLLAKAGRKQWGGSGKRRRSK